MLHHALSLRSAYSPVQPDTRTAVVSSLNSEGGAMVDYIFYSTGSASAEGDALSCQCLPYHTAKNALLCFQPKYHNILKSRRIF